MNFSKIVQKSEAKTKIEIKHGNLISEKNQVGKKFCIRFGEVKFSHANCLHKWLQIQYGKWVFASYNYWLLRVRVCEKTR